MDYSKGFSSRYIATIVDPATWADVEEFDITGGSIDIDASTALLQSATLTTDSMIGEEWIRIYLAAEQNGDEVKTALFTGITSTPSRKLDGLRITRDITCYSVLKPASDVLLPIGYYAPKGSGASLIRELIGGEVDGVSPGTAEPIVADQNETRLSMARKIADAIGWQIVIDGYGAVLIKPKSTSSGFMIGAENDIMALSVTDTSDWYDCPNVLRVVSDAGVAVCRDDRGGRLSVEARGREIWREEQMPAAGNIAEYARKRLKELQSPARELVYARRFVPGINVGDIVTINYPSAELVGDFQILKQSMSLEYGCPVSEKAVYYEH